MGDLEAARKIGDAICVSKTPDFCKSPDKPVPYTVVGVFDKAERTATTVRMTSCVAFTMNSRIPIVQGNEAGIGGGMVSGVNVGYCKPVSFIETVFAEGHNIISHEMVMEMNCSGPDSAGNTVGEVVYMVCQSVSTSSSDVAGGGGSGDGGGEGDGGSAGGGGDGSDGGDGGGGDDESGGPAAAAESADEIAEPDPEDLAAAQAEIDQAQAELAQAQSEINAINAEMALDATQAAADLAGLADPTPTSDAISGAISLGRGDYVGAGLSVISMFPYLGDALAKPIKAAKAAKKAKSLAKAMAIAKKLKAAAAKKLKAAKEKLAKLLKDETGAVGNISQLKKGQEGAKISESPSGKGGRGGGKAKGKGSKFGSKEKLDDHFERHGTDFGAKDPAEYQAMADDFLTGPKGDGVLEKVRANGDLVRFDPKSDAFGVVKSDGTIKTFYKPDPQIHGKPTNMDYFNDQ